MASRMIRPVHGLVALVTGAASGLGRATAERLARSGASVLLADLPKSDGAKVADSIGKSAHFAPVDVTSEKDVKSAIDECVSRFGRLDAVVNCAGIGIAVVTYNFNKDRLHNLDDFDTVLKVNTLGTFNVMRLAAQAMCKNEPWGEDGSRGCIVNTSSVAACDGQMGQVAYSASKGAIVAMTLPAARDLSKYGIRVNTIAPGLYDTPLLASLPDKVRTFLSQLVVTPKRLGHPDEFAHTVEYLITNPYVNGEVLRVDGALRMPP